MTTKSPQAVNRNKVTQTAKEVVKQQSTAPIRLKTVVRRLPPNLPEAIFWQSVQPWVTEETVAWKVFYQGKLRKKFSKENIPSRAYLLFKNEDALAVFNKEYDGHVFRDKQGNESQAVVEFAPNQKVPPEKKKADSRHGTIQQDEDYLSFIASLQNPQEKLPEVDADALLASTVQPEEPKTTPLLVALREQKQSQEKKIASAEAAKIQSRKVAPPPPKPEPPEPPAPAPAKKGRKGKGAQPTVPAPVPQPTPVAPQPPPKASNGGGRSRPHQSQTATPASAPSVSPTISSVSIPANKDTSAASSTIAASAGETSQPRRRNRPVLGASRHLKAALSGAGVQVPPGSPSASSSSAAPSNATGKPQSGPPEGAPRGPRGRGGGGDKRPEQSNDTSANQDGGGGGRGGAGGAKQRQRPPPQNNGPTIIARPSETITPRILTRQEVPPPSFNIADPSNINLPSPSVPDAGGGRGRGGRRGRGQ
ncbi:Smg-4/UPF3 family-domain-containing protein [Hysterangium stoloniferum]|nr:Smg-4/UPF3 family-domain-containing protein [Hysterangium stoloniferum]